MLTNKIQIIKFKNKNWEDHLLYLFKRNKNIDIVLKIIKVIVKNKSYMNQIKMILEIKD